MQPTLQNLWSKMFSDEHFGKTLALGVVLTLILMVGLIAVVKSLTNRVPTISNLVHESDQRTFADRQTFYDIHCTQKKLGQTQTCDKLYEWVMVASGIKKPFPFRDELTKLDQQQLQRLLQHGIHHEKYGALEWAEFEPLPVRTVDRFEDEIYSRPRKDYDWLKKHIPIEEVDEKTHEFFPILGLPPKENNQLDKDSMPIHAMDDKSNNIILYQHLHPDIP